MSPMSPESPANHPLSPAVPEPERPSGGAVSVGIVLVSHSRALAEAAMDLARRLIVAVDVPVELAAGLTDGELGTDPGAVVSAVERLADRCDGVLVLADLGSGIIERREWPLGDARPGRRRAGSALRGPLRRGAARCLRRRRDR